MNRDPIRQLKASAMVYLVLGLLLVAVGIKYRMHVCLFPIVLGFLVYFFLTRAFGKLFQAANLNREQMRDFQRVFQQQFARQNLPRQVFWLLFAVAEADGASEAEERELVRKFLLERFTDPATAADLREWEATRIPPEQVGALALGLGRVLTTSERETVFTWCCLVAFVDKKYGTDEHIVLQQIARAFGFVGDHARRLFHHAKSMHLGGDASGRTGGRTSGQTGGGRWERQYGGRQQYGGGSGGGNHTRARGAVSGRAEALAILGLDKGASRDDIRKRHRELVREFHPDKHQHLGEIAAKEAEERFRQVQAAYEELKV